MSTYLQSPASASFRWPVFLLLIGLLASLTHANPIEEITPATEVTAAEVTTVTEIPLDTTEPPAISSCSELSDPTLQQACNAFIQSLEPGETYSRLTVVRNSENLKAAMESATESTVFILTDTPYNVTGTIRPRHSFGMLGKADITTLTVSGDTEDMSSIISVNIEDKKRTLRISGIKFASSGDGSTIQLNSMIEGGTTSYLDIATILESDFSHNVTGNPLSEYLAFEDVRGSVNINGTGFDLTRVNGSAVKAVCKAETEGQHCRTKATFIDNEVIGIRSASALTLDEIPEAEIATNMLTLDSRIKSLEPPLFSLLFSDLNTNITATIHDNALAKDLPGVTSVLIAAPDAIDTTQLHGDIYVYNNTFHSAVINKSSDLSGITVHNTAPIKPTTTTEPVKKGTNYGVDIGAPIGTLAVVTGGSWLVAGTICAAKYQQVESIPRLLKYITYPLCVTAINWKIQRGYGYGAL